MCICLLSYHRRLRCPNSFKFSKGRSSRLLRQEFAYLARMKCLWSPSWFVPAVGGAPLEVVKRYAGNQKVAAACHGAVV